MDGWYGVPSGHLEGDEPAHVAAIREAREEVGIEIDPADLHMMHLMHRKAEGGDHERFDVGFEVTKWRGEPCNAEPEKCDRLLWAAPAALPDNTVPALRHIVDQMAAGSRYSSFNFRAVVRALARV